MKTWFRCPSQLGVHPRLLDAGPDACWLWVVLSGWQAAKGEELSNEELNRPTMSILSGLSCRRVAIAQAILIDRGILWLDKETYTWTIEDLSRTRRKVRCCRRLPVSPLPSAQTGATC